MTDKKAREIRHLQFSLVKIDISKKMRVVSAMSNLSLKISYLLSLLKMIILKLRSRKHPLIRMLQIRSKKILKR